MISGAIFAGIGGAVGAILRYVSFLTTARFLPAAAVPWGTLFVNVLGCFIIGILAACVEVRQAFSPAQRAFLFTGVLGGYTTYSTFGLESFQLLKGGFSLQVICYIAGHIIAGLLAVWGGWSITERILT